MISVQFVLFLNVSFGEGKSTDVLLCSGKLENISIFLITHLQRKCLSFHFCGILIFVHCSMTERLTRKLPGPEVWNANPGPAKSYTAL